MPDHQTLIRGLAFGESPRWHDGRLWLCNWGAQEVIAVEPTGGSEVVARVPTSLPFSIDWLPDGRLLIVSGPERLILRRESDGSVVTQAELTELSAYALNEIVVDGRGNAYVNGACFDIIAGEPFAPGLIAVVTPDGCARAVADGIAFPNGMVVTPDDSTLIVAESYARRLTAGMARLGPDVRRRAHRPGGERSGALAARRPAVGSGGASGAVWRANGSLGKGGGWMPRGGGSCRPPADRPFVGSRGSLRVLGNVWPVLPAQRCPGAQRSGEVRRTAGSWGRIAHIS